MTLSRAIVTALALCLLATGTANAQSLFTAEVEYDASAQDARKLAYESALTKVLMRVTSSEVSGDPEMVSTLFPDPSAYVVRFSAGEPGMLNVVFDGAAVQDVLRRSGHLVWGDQRPPTLIWIAVDWGDGQREIVGGADDATPPGDELDDTTIRRDLLRQRIQEAAERRGLPVLFPLLDIEDLSAINFADVWGGFDEPVIEASRRYEVESVLIGRIREDGVSFGRWTHYLGEIYESFGGEPEQVVDWLANQLAAEFSIGGNAPLERVQLEVSGIVSVDAYAAMEALLSEIVVVDRFQVRGVTGDQVDYDLDVFGGADRLSRALKLAGLIEEEQADGGFFMPDREPVPLTEARVLKFFFEL